MAGWLAGAGSGRLRAEASGQLHHLHARQGGRGGKLLVVERRVTVVAGDARRLEMAEVVQGSIEQVGAKLRDMMPWINAKALVDKSKN